MEGGELLADHLDNGLVVVLIEYFLLFLHWSIIMFHLSQFGK